MMYNTHTPAGQSRATGLATVVALHVALVGAILAIKQPATVLTQPPIILKYRPDIVAPSEPALPEITPEEVTLSESIPQEVFELPEFTPAEPVNMIAATPLEPATISTVPTSGMTGDIRRSAQLPGRLDKPPYPRASERLNEEGLSTVEACVSERGRISSARLVQSSGFYRLDDAAVKWVKELRNFKLLLPYVALATELISKRCANVESWPLNPNWIICTIRSKK